LRALRPLAETITAVIAATISATISSLRSVCECGIQVSEQPLTFGALTVNGCKQVRYNVRKLSELPYHLIESGMEAELRKHVLFNYDWLHSKLAAASLPDVLADFHMATTSFSDAAKVPLIP